MSFSTTICWLGTKLNIFFQVLEFRSPKADSSVLNLIIFEHKMFERCIKQIPILMEKRIFFKHHSPFIFSFAVEKKSSIIETEWVARLFMEYWDLNFKITTLESKSAAITTYNWPEAFQWICVKWAMNPHHDISVAKAQAVVRTVYPGPGINPVLQYCLKKWPELDILSVRNMPSIIFPFRVVSDWRMAWDRGHNLNAMFNRHWQAYLPLTCLIFFNPFSAHRVFCISKLHSLFFVFLLN